MQGYLKTTSLYANRLEEVWLWMEFPFHDQFGGKDTGIDLVARTVEGEYSGHSMQMLCGGYLHQQTRRRYIPRHLGQALRNRIRHDGIRTAAVDLNDEQMELHGRADDPQSESSGNATEPYRPRKRRRQLEQPRTRPLRRGLPVQTLCHTGAPAGGHRPGPRLFQDRRSHRPTRPYARQAHHGLRHRQNLHLAANCRERNRRPRSGAVPGAVDCAFGTSPAWRGLQPGRPGADDGCLHPVSDGQVSKPTEKKDNDTTSVIDLALPASTDVPSIVKQLQHARRHNAEGLTVVFSTYQSIERHFAGPATTARRDPTTPSARSISSICDEAHRTTGVTLKDETESAFVRVHNNDFLRAVRRIYMTATPRLYTDETKKRAEENSAVLCSMDDRSMYGDEIYRIGFGKAVKQELLSERQGPHPRRGRKGHYPHAAKRTDPRGRNHRRG